MSLGTGRPGTTAPQSLAVAVDLIVAAAVAVAYVSIGVSHWRSTAGWGSLWICC